MKLKVLMVSVLAFFALAGTAAAVGYHMRYGQAKQETRLYAEEACEQERECTGYGTGQCFRSSESTFNCGVGLFFPNRTSGGEIECDWRLHWGVNHRTGGVIRLNGHSRIHCHAA